MRRGWGAGEQTDRKREACRPPGRKLTSGSSGVSQLQLSLALRPSLSLCPRVWPANMALVFQRRGGETALQGCWVQLPIRPPDVQGNSPEESRGFILRVLCFSVPWNEPVL